MYDNTIFKGTFQEVLSYIPEEGKKDAVRLLQVLNNSGADNETSLAALFRWTATRLWYSGIRSGLQKFFEADIA